jgi:hypothetical protein
MRKYASLPNAPHRDRWHQIEEENTPRHTSYTTMRFRTIMDMGYVFPKIAGLWSPVGVLCWLDYIINLLHLLAALAEKGEGINAELTHKEAMALFRKRRSGIKTKDYFFLNYLIPEEEVPFFLSLRDTLQRSKKIVTFQ